MAKVKNTEKMRRFEIPFFEGINALVSDNLAKKEEFRYVKNARSRTIGTIEKRQGTRRLGNILVATANYGLFFFENDVAAVTGIYRISTVSSNIKIYYLNNSAVWTALAGTYSAANFSNAIAEYCSFLVNGTDNNMYIKGTDGTTIITSATAAGHLYNSPKAKKINYYKGRLYLADYTNAGGTRYRNGIMMSSPTLGLLSLVDGDHVAADCEADDWIKVTDTKYIRSTDTIDVYRGGTKIADITIKAKTEDTFQINAITFVGAYTTLDSADEIWVDGTYTGDRLFRWADYPDGGIDVKQYDTFKISGGQNDGIKMMTNIGDVMVISNSYNIAIWNGSSLKNLDNGIGCVSDRGYVKAFDTLFFLGYKGIYQTVSGMPELISSKVQSYIDGATKAGLEAGAMGIKGTSIFCSIGDITLYNADGSENETLSDVVLEKNLKTQNWYVHTGITATQFKTYVSSSSADRLIYTSTDSGYPLFEFLVGTLDDEVTSDNEILFRVDTGNTTLSKEFEKYCYPQKIIIEVERGSNMTCFISLDNESFYELQGKVTKGCSVINVTGKDSDRSSPPKCRKINISVRDYSKQLCKISKAAIIYKLTLEEVQENLT